MDRKTFIKKTAGGLLMIVPAYALMNCSSSDDSDSNTPPTGGSNCRSSITNNHGHNLTVSATDVNAGVDKTYNIEGSAGHVHEVTVTSFNFSSLSNNQSVVINSTTSNSHSHSITVTCA